MQKKLISVIIPVYNEIERLKNLYVVYHYLKKKKFSYELIVVDDGSSPRNANYLKKINKDIPFKIIRYSENMGKGYAIKQGVLNSKGDFIFFTDIDLSVPIKEIEKFIKLADKNPIIVGSRKKKGSKIILRQSKIREFMGEGFTKMSQLILGIPVSDFTCGFKCFQKKAGKEIFKRASINRWGFDSEIMLIGSRLGYSILEMPVEWSHSAQTKVSFPRDIIISLIELITIKSNDLRGFYLKHEDETS